MQLEIEVKCNTKLFREKKSSALACEKQIFKLHMMAVVKPRISTSRCR